MSLQLSNITIQCLFYTSSSFYFICYSCSIS
nr:MAG TPA: hypothetical protein [Bacteriophage sp.]DAK12394.1 MAG TPA: hypothetical protein [Caudoviricetes sp.]DAL21812.1 MAG TPA_asm: hypothetical protein [Caudoviricetes sp.]DAM00307.1 MAG TPA: hypothetical protein [Caudoviricetes sp.]DAM14830.1 MAG TPA: hypothetical protein [Caudoviricetes sp.]